MWNLLGWQRTVGTRPAHILLQRAAEGLLRYADLQGTEAGIAADLVRQHLVEGSRAGAVGAHPRAGHQGAERLRVAVSAVGVVESAQNMDIVLYLADRRQARRDVVV